MALALFTLLNFTAKAQVDADLVGKEAPAFSLKNIDGNFMKGLSNFAC